MPGIVWLFQVADNDSTAGTGMYKLAVLEVDAHVSHLFAGSTAGEEHQISLTQVAAGDFAALFQLPVCASRQTGVVNFLIKLRYQSGTVRSTLAVATCTIGGAYPFGGMDVQLVVVLQLNIHSQAEGCLRQGFVVQAWRGGMAGTQTYQ